MDIYEAVTKIVADNESARYGNFFRSDILTDDLFKQLATIFDKSAFTLFQSEICQPQKLLRLASQIASIYFLVFQIVLKSH
jgi:hypothetical protein